MAPQSESRGSQAEDAAEKEKALRASAEQQVQTLQEHVDELSKGAELAEAAEVTVTSLAEARSEIQRLLADNMR